MLNIDFVFTGTLREFYCDANNVQKQHLGNSWILVIGVNVETV